MSVEAFEALIDIEQNCLHYASPLPSQNIIGNVWRGIGFSLSQIHFVLPLEQVIEVLPLPPLSPLPGRSNWFLGVSNLRGHLLSITDLKCFVFQECCQPLPDNRVLVVEHEGTKLGFLVEKLYNIKRFPEETKMTFETETFFSEFQLPVSSQNGLAHFLVGKFQEGKREWIIFDLKRIFKIPEFYHVLMQEQ